jgi:preprotein translocase subunit SecG
MENKSENRFSKLLPNLSNYLLGATLICYLSGFAITNLYLGSLGIVNLDILRSRYIVTGLLFIIFIIAISYLVFGFRKTLIKYEDTPSTNILKKVLWYSIQNISILYFAIPAIAIFAGSANNISPVISQSDSSIPWEQWLNTEPVKILRSVVVILSIIFIVMILFVGILMIINPKNKDGTKSTRREMIGKLFEGLKEDYKKIIISILLIFIATYIFFVLSSILTLLQTSDVRSSVTRDSYLHAGWSRYLGAIIVVYGLLAIYLLLIFFTPSQSNNKGKEDEVLDDPNPTSEYSSWIYIVALIIGIIVPAYAFGVYPYLPQQIGGGRLIPVEVTASSDELNSIFTTQTNETYLIDRAPDNSLFLIVDQPTENYKIIEVSNDLIESIVFYESP